MDLLKDVIAQKRKQIDDLVIEGSSGSKMVRQSDLFRQEKEAYLQRQKDEDETRLKHASSTSSFNLDEALDETSAKTELSRIEVIKRLRARGQPIRLFSESDTSALKRLRKLEMEQPDLNEGWQNEFQSALQKVENEIVEEMIKSGQDSIGKHDVKIAEISTDVSWDQIQSRAHVLGEGNEPNRDCDTILEFINYLLKRWGCDLNARDESVKRSARGRLEAGTHKQTVENLRPLVRSLEKYTINSDIRHHLINICRLCIVDRDYIRANNAYMEMAIGNAPWPVGVTRSGIHQRPGSSKAYVSNVAHVLNDETQNTSMDLNV